LFSSNKQPEGQLPQLLSNIPQQPNSPTFEFHGTWGSLAVTGGTYKGFQPLDTPDHVISIIGGPLLNFRDNNFLIQPDSNIGTRAIYDRWKVTGDIDWSIDLNGPFAIILIDKSSGEVTTITDLLSFIPLFKTSSNKQLIIGSHADIVAKCAGETNSVDAISVADFIINGVVTFPHTFYTAIEQISPASEINHTRWRLNQLSPPRYWTPHETYTFKNKRDAAINLRESLVKYLADLTSDMSKVAILLSGGEDSRAVLSMLPRHIERNSFVFADSFNIEARIAKMVAKIDGCSFSFTRRSKGHYLKHFPNTSWLSGSGGQFHHLHAYGFHEALNLQAFTAVLGGFSSDALIKASHAPLRYWPNKVPRVVQVLARDNERSFQDHGFFRKDALAEVANRRRLHLELIKQFRDRSASEWFELWPASMNTDHPFLAGNRRIFSSYEPFTSIDAIKISSAIPRSGKSIASFFSQQWSPF